MMAWCPMGSTPQPMAVPRFALLQSFSIALKLGLTFPCGVGVVTVDHRGSPRKSLGLEDVIDDFSTCFLNANTLHLKRSRIHMDVL